MIKQLLFSAAVAMAFSASAAEPTVLWTAENPEEGVEVKDWNRIFELTPEQVAELDVQAGDIFNMTVTKVEEGWPQVAMFDATVGWPPLTNAFAGGDREYPAVIGLQINSVAMWKAICEHGVNFSGGGVWVSEVSYEKVELPFEVNPNAVWFGPKQCNWGNPVDVNKDALATLAPGDKIIVQYGEGEHTLQFMPGGWGTPNIPTYQAWATNGFLTNEEDDATYTMNFTSAQYNFDWEVDDEIRTFDLYELYKANGLMMHGPCLVNQVIYIPSENNAPFNEALKEIEAIEAKYNATVAEIEEEYPGIDLGEWKEIGSMIQQTKQGAIQALESANEDGEKFFFPVDTETFDGMIAEMVKAAPNQAAYSKVMAEIAEVEAKYNEAITAVESKYPVLASEWKEIIGGQLAQAKTGAAQALYSANEDGTEYNFPFDAEYFEGMIAEMEKAVKNQEAYDKVIATINAVEEDYNDAVEAIKEVEPDFDFADYKEIENQIADAKKNADNALAVANEEGEEFTFAFNGEDIENFITEMKKAGFEKANTLAYDKVVAAIAEVEANYTEAVADIEKEYPGIDLGDWKEIIGGQLAQVKSGAEQALAAASDNGELFNFAFDGEEYEGMIAEMKKQAPNYAAYDKVMAKINAVEEDYNESVKAVKEVNPDFDFADYKEIEDQIADAKKWAATALANANEEGDEFTFAFSGEDIENFITEMRKAGFADYNQAAYDQVVADITAVEAKYDAAIVKIEETYPDFDLTEWKSIIGGQLEEVKKGAEQALAAASDNGELFNFPFTGEDIENAITDMEKDAAQSGIANIEAEVAAGTAKIFTLDGKAHFAPVKGQVNVIVRGNKSVKVMVK